MRLQGATVNDLTEKRESCEHLVNQTAELAFGRQVAVSFESFAGCTTGTVAY
jgi:hypothetical protein